MTTPPAEPQDTKDTLVQIYWAIFEAWSAQVNSYWTRTNYFAVFEVAAIAGSWAVLDDRTLITSNRSLLIAAGLTFLLGLILTVAWIFSNLKSYDYHMYWWGVLEEIEKGDGWISRAPCFVSGYQERRKKRPILGYLKYHNFTNWFVPTTFLIIWAILVFGLALLRWS